MIKNLGYKILSITLVLVTITIVIAYSPKAYTPLVSATSTLNFGSTLPGTATDLTMTVTGAVLGDGVVLGVSNGSMLLTVQHLMLSLGKKYYINSKYKLCQWLA